MKTTLLIKRHCATAYSFSSSLRSLGYPSPSRLFRHPFFSDNTKGGKSGREMRGSYIYIWHLLLVPREKERVQCVSVRERESDDAFLLIHQVHAANIAQSFIYFQRHSTALRHAFHVHQRHSIFYGLYRIPTADVAILARDAPKKPSLSVFFLRMRFLCGHSSRSFE